MIIIISFLKYNTKKILCFVAVVVVVILIFHSVRIFNKKDIIINIHMHIDKRKDDG